MLTYVHEHSWVPRLKNTFEEQGLLESCTHYHPTPPHLRLFFTQMQLLVNEEYSWYALENSGADSRGPKRRKLIQEAAREMQEGVAITFIIETTTGRKRL